MERLTTEYAGYSVPVALCSIDSCGCADDCDSCNDICTNNNGDCDNCPIQKAFNKLKAYEDADEAGLLFRLPCRPGDILYRLDKQSGDITPKKVLKIEAIFSTTARDGFDWWIEFETSGACAKHNFGKTVFRNKVDAIHAFEEYQSRNET